jgi:hydrogenase maturation factor
MMGELPKDRYVTTGGARPGDSVILTKGAGIEGTGILATDLAEILRQKVDSEVLIEAAELLKMISVVREALVAMEAGGIHSFHTPTEGGIINGIWEMTEAADVGVRISEKEIPIAPVTSILCEVLGIDPLKLLGSGALLIAAEPGKVNEIVSALEGIDVKASVIGEIKPKEKGRFLVRKDGSHTPIEAVDQDHLFKVLQDYGIGR